MNYIAYNKAAEYSYAYGGYVIYELLSHHADTVSKIFIHEKLKRTEDVERIFQLANIHDIEIIENSRLITKLSKKDNIYIMAVFTKYHSHIDDEKHIVLDNPQDMGNLGTIIRVMCGFGYHNLVLIQPCVDHYDPRVIRASMGSIFHINITVMNSMEEYMNVYDFMPKYLFMLGGKTKLHTINAANDVHSLIFGNEQHGIDTRYIDAGESVVIQHLDAIDSLNLSMSVGISLYHFDSINKKAD